MPSSPETLAIRDRIRAHTLASEDSLAQGLVQLVAMDDAGRRRAQENAADFVKKARANATRSGLIDKFLQEYGLSTAEGVTLMRLAEALLRTPDAATANTLIEDKIEAGDWASHAGKSPFPLVNFSTRALMLTAAWLDDVEANDPLRRMVKGTKDALDRLGEPVIRASVAQAMRIMGEHFVLGETINEAMDRGRGFAKKGYLFSFDMLGEAAHTAADADKYFDDYQTAIKAIAKHSGRARAAENPGISVKLSALHPRYEYTKKHRVLTELGERVLILARQAKEANMGFNIDAEEADRLDISLDLIDQALRDRSLKDWTGFGVVVQAYQRRAPFVLDWLAARAREADRRIMVRLVKGAYWDSEIKRAQVMGLESYPVFTRKVLTDLSYIACARKILSSTDAFYPQFATHNALTATTVMEMANGNDDYEFQRLHGMGEALHDSLIEDGARSRIYAPVGGHKELLPYLVRRLLENGANSSFVNQLIDADLSVDEIVADPVDEIASFKTFANPNIPAPRDHLNGRLSAKGWDETDPQTAMELSELGRAKLSHLTASPLIAGSAKTSDIQNVQNPATGELAGTVQLASPEDINTACDAAFAYLNAWAATPAKQRADALRKCADLLEERGEYFMQIAVKEAGKSWPDAIAEVREAVDFLRYYADEGEKLKGTPLGIVACISPWNFPLAIFLGQISANLAAGNCVIAKPAEQTPLIAFEAVRLLHEAGIPQAALQFLPGDGLMIGAPLVTHKNVSGVVFTGSTGTAQAIKKSLIASGKADATLIAETGGINAMIVDSTALLEQAVTDVVDSAFQSAGQRCSACRVVCVQDDIFDRFEKMLTGAMAELHIGDPADLETDVGPVIDEEARQNIQSNIERLKNDARLIAVAPDIADDISGTFIRPIAFEVTSIEALSTEIFAPVLHVVRYKAANLLALIDKINALGYGLTMGIHTRIDETMDAVARRARIGNIYVNRNQIGAVVGVQPFGGEGLSGTGPKAGGPHYLQALVKRPFPQTGAAPVLTDAEIDDSTKDKLRAAADAYTKWNISNRASILRNVVNAFPTEEEAQDFTATLEELALNTELPGPTGESNTLKQRGRGVALCLGGEDTTIHQVLTALGAGNTVLARSSDALEQLQSTLDDGGAPAGILTLLDHDMPTGLLDEHDIRLVVYDGDHQGRVQIETILSNRTGPIVPVVSSLDAPWRFATERTLTINTTAAGGDVRLLSLAD